MRNHSNEIELDLHQNEHASETNFHMNGFVLRFVLKKRQTTRIVVFCVNLLKITVIKFKIRAIPI